MFFLLLFILERVPTEEQGKDLPWKAYPIQNGFNEH